MTLFYTMSDIITSPKAQELLRRIRGLALLASSITSTPDCRPLALLRLPLSQSHAGAAAVLVDEFDAGRFSIKSCAPRLLKSQRIDDFQERELIKIGVAGADLPDAVLENFPMLCFGSDRGAAPPSTYFSKR
jgi:hypothetical protein